MPNLLNKIFKCLIIFFLIESISSCSHENEAAQSNKVAVVSMLELNSGEDIFNKRKIKTIAYINIDRGELVAYPFRDSYIARDSLTSVKLDLDFEEASQLAEVFKDRYCLITGIIQYEGNDKNSSYPRLGVLHNPQIIFESDTSRAEEVGSNEILYHVKSE